MQTNMHVCKILLFEIFMIIRFKLTIALSFNDLLSRLFVNFNSIFLPLKINFD